MSENKSTRKIIIICVIILSVLLSVILCLDFLKLRVSEFDNAADTELEYLINNVSPSRYISDYNYVDRGDIPAGTPKGSHNVYVTPHGVDFEEFCLEKNNALFGFWERLVDIETVKLSETEEYAYYNTSYTTMVTYTNSDGSTEDKPAVSELNFTLFLKNFVGNEDSHVYTGNMTAEAVKNNFDVYLYDKKLLAREVTETDTTFVYEYISYEKQSGFWSTFDKFYQYQITIQKDSGEFASELISIRSPK